MMTFLWVVLGVVVGLIVVVALFLWWLKRKVTGVMGALASALGSGVPPFRITLEPAPGATFTDAKAAAQLTADLEALGYECAGDYAIPEMGGVHVRGFCHRETACAAALYEHPQAGLLLDLVRLHKDRSHVLVTTTPDQGLEDPPSKRTVRLGGAPVVAAMHERLLVECEAREAVPLTPGVFAAMFTAAYAAEMDWRIERGGVTREEVLGAARTGGQEEPDDRAVERVQRQWRYAIAEHWKEAILESFLNAGAVSASEWEEYRERVCVVHEDIDPQALAEELAACVVDGAEGDDEDEDEQRIESFTRELNETLGASADVLDNAAKAIELLPAGNEVRLLGEVNQPKKAKIYLLPHAA